MPLALPDISSGQETDLTRAIRRRIAPKPAPPVEMPKPVNDAISGVRDFVTREIGGRFGFGPMPESATAIRRTIGSVPVLGGLNEVALDMIDRGPAGSRGPLFAPTQAERMEALSGMAIGATSGVGRAARAAKAVAKPAAKTVTLEDGTVVPVTKDQADFFQSPFSTAVPKTEAAATGTESLKRQIAESIAKQRANPTPTEELGKRFPTSRADLENMRRRGDSVAGEASTADDPLMAQLSGSLKARGIDPDTLKAPPEPPYAPKEPSSFVKARPDKMAVHDANEAAIAAAQQGDWNAVETALTRVKEAGGSLDHTANRLRKAGALKATGGEIEAITRTRAGRPTETDLRSAAIRSRARPKKVETAAPLTEPRPSAEIIPIESIRDIKAKNAATLDELRERIAASRAGGTIPPTGPTPPTGGTTPPAPPAAPPTPPSGWERALSVWNVPKTVKASLDLSAPFRQGIFLSAGHPGEFFGAFKPMVQALRSDEFARTLDAQLRTKQRPGLYIAPIDNAAGLAGREEAFMSSFADKIPGIAASNRAYVTFLNKLRADVYDNVLEGWTKSGKTVADADRKGLANVINHLTGRGDIPGVSENVAAALNGLFFSPRFVASRFQSIGDALGVVKSPSSLAAREAASDLAKFVGAGLTVLTLAQMGGAEVELDPRSANFGKIRIGPHTVDIWGGSQQVARYAAQFITGQRVVASGKNAGKVQDVPRGETLGRFIRSKLSPSAGEVNNILGIVGGGGPSAKDRKANAGQPLGDQVIGRDFVGDPVTPKGLPHDLLAPMGWDTGLEAIAKDDDKVRGTVVALLGLIGFGTNTFDDDGSGPAPSATRTPSTGTFRLALPGASSAPNASPSTGSTFRLSPPTGSAPASAPRSSFQLRPPTSSGGRQPSLALPERGEPLPPDDVAGAISRVAQQSGIDPRLALAVAQVESGLDPYAVGDNGESHGLFQENVRGRGAGRTPDYDVARQTERFAADVQRLLASGFRGTPGEIAAAAQRPYDPVGYAKKVNAAYGR